MKETNSKTKITMIPTISITVVGLLFGLLCLIGNIHETQGESLYAFLRKRPELTLFFDKVRQSPYLKSALAWKRGTLFAPTDSAIRDFEDLKKFDHTTLLYHFANVGHKYEDLKTQTSISTEIPGNSFIWITNTTTGLFLNDAYVSRWDYIVEVEGDMSQFVHIIDTVLEPTVPTDNQGTYLSNPDGWRFIEHAKSYAIASPHQATYFARQISMKNMKNVFTEFDQHTFFIPLDNALKDMAQLKIDEAIINAHVIKGKALFLRSTDSNMEFETVGFNGHGHSQSASSHTGNTRQHHQSHHSSNDSLHVVLRIEKEKINDQEKWLVQSDTRHGDAMHRKGVVQAEILKGNIPVKNGVVHLISKPLAVIDTDVFDTLQWYGGKYVFNMKEFVDLIREIDRRGYGYGNELKMILKDPRGVTLFVPSNEALKQPEFLAIKNNLTAMNEILKTHILKEIVSADDMIEHSRMKRVPFQVPTMIPGRQLLFSVAQNIHGEKVIHLEGGGVNATVEHPDFGAINGYIHIIDKVLGIPKQSIMEKLRTNPMLQSTYHLWKKVKMDEKYNDSQLPFTIFAPSEMAWQNIHRMNYNAYQNLFYGTDTENMELLVKVLERHLIVKNSLMISDLKSFTDANKNTTMSKGIKGNWTISLKYPIKTVGGNVAVNISNVMLPRKVIMAIGGQNTEIIKSTTKNPPGTVRGTTTTSTTTLSPVVRGSQQNKDEDSHYYVYWNKMWAHVIRPNVKCTNGIIHIIDDVLMDNEEITVAAAQGLMPPLTMILTSLFVLLAIMIELGMV